MMYFFIAYAVSIVAAFACLTMFTTPKNGDGKPFSDWWHFGRVVLVSVFWPVVPLALLSVAFSRKKNLHGNM